MLFVAFQRFKNFIYRITPKITPAITNNAIMLLNENPPRLSAGGFTITTGGEGRSIENPAKPIAQHPTVKSINPIYCTFLLQIK